MTHKRNEATRREREKERCAHRKPARLHLVVQLKWIAHGNGTKRAAGRRLSAAELNWSDRCETQSHSFKVSLRPAGWRLLVMSSKSVNRPPTTVHHVSRMLSLAQLLAIIWHLESRLQNALVQTLDIDTLMPLLKVQTSQHAFVDHLCINTFSIFYY